MSYYYDADGLRAGKNKQATYVYEYSTGNTVTQVSNTSTSYQYIGDKLIYQVKKNTDTNEIINELYFFYDSLGKLTAIRYIKGTTDHYYYVTTNAQGDVLGIYSGSGVLLASYEYDAWGKCSVTSHDDNYTIGSDNPIRYRGYYYDSDTGLYYLQSRYYDPEIGRFLNSDSITDSNAGILGYNTFLYCANNPVNYFDSTGYGIKEIIKTCLEVLDPFIDELVKIGKNSPSKNIKAFCYGLDYARKLDSYKNNAESANDELERVDAIKLKYTEDILTVANGGTLTSTADPVFFPDLNSYQNLCVVGYDRMQSNYPKESIPSFSAADIANSMGGWDEETCMYIASIVAVKIFFEDILLPQVEE